MRVQEGILISPKKHSLVQIYNFDDLPLIAMNVARIAAQIPSMASELVESHRAREQKHNSEGSAISPVVGFGPMMWILITPDVPVRGGFRAFHETEINEVEVPGTNGDILLYFSSDKVELNRTLAEQVKEYFGRKGILVEEIILEGGEHSDIEREKETVLIDDANNLDTAKSSFVLTQKFKANAEFPCDLPHHSFPCKTEHGPGRYTLTFSNQPAELEKNSENAFHPPISRGLFFLPSLDLLTSLRMGGIRMGSLAINAKWKE